MSSKDCLSFACFHSLMEQCLSASQMYFMWIIHCLRLVFRECDDFIIECQLVVRATHYSEEYCEGTESQQLTYTS